MRSPYPRSWRALRGGRATSPKQHPRSWVALLGLVIRDTSIVVEGSCGTRNLTDLAGTSFIQNYRESLAPGWYPEAMTSSNLLLRVFG